MDKELFAMLGTLKQLGEERFTRVLGQVLDNEKVITAVQKMLLGSMELKNALTRTIHGALVQLRLPTTDDFRIILDELTELDERLFSIEDRLYKIEKNLEEIAENKGKNYEYKKDCVNK